MWAFSNTFRLYLYKIIFLDSRIYIFGGYNEKGFLNVEVVVGEFDNNMGKNTEKIQIIKGREGII